MTDDIYQINTIYNNQIKLILYTTIDMIDNFVLKSLDGDLAQIVDMLLFNRLMSLSLTVTIYLIIKILIII